jgi:hypothetical protein
MTEGMEGLVEIGPGDSDEVFDAARDGGPFAVDGAEGAIAVFDAVGDDPEGEEVVDLVDADLLALQFLVDAEGALEASFDAGRDVFAREFDLYGVADLLEHALGSAAFGFDGKRYLFEGGRVEVAKAEIFEFGADFAHTEAMGDGA